jgi:hypothetical protein
MSDNGKCGNCGTPYQENAPALLKNGFKVCQKCSAYTRPAKRAGE